MGNKRIDLGRSVHALCSEYPELLEVMKDLGFKDIREFDTSKAEKVVQAEAGPYFFVNFS